MIEVNICDLLEHLYTLKAYTHSQYIKSPVATENIKKINLCYTHPSGFPGFSNAYLYIFWFSDLHSDLASHISVLKDI